MPFGHRHNLMVNRKDAKPAKKNVAVRIFAIFASLRFDSPVTAITMLRGEDLTPRNVRAHHR